MRQQLDFFSLPNGDNSDLARIDFLRREIARHSALYYHGTSPEISDVEFDRLKRELTNLEQKLTEHITSRPLVGERINAQLKMPTSAKNSKITTSENSQGFVAIDFEILYPAKETVCAVGMAKYANGVCVGRFYSLIKPPEGFSGRSYSDIHGITPDMLVNAPLFPDILPQMEQFAGDYPLVAHNANMERECFRKTFEHFGIVSSSLRIYDILDTYEMSGKSLVDSCKELGIEVANHHDPLDDAINCAKIYLAMSGISETRIITHERTKRPVIRKDNKIPPECKIPKEESDIADKNNPFFRKTIVFTGDFLSFPDRSELGLFLWDHGAILKDSISTKTDFLLAGDTPGPSKMAKAKDLNVKIISEFDFLKLAGLSMP